MASRNKILLFIFICITFNIFSQKDFRFFGSNKHSQRISFKLINNLIVIPLEVNGKKLSFILDTGVNKTILFNLSKEDSLYLKNIKKVSLQGLGDGVSIDAILSKKQPIADKKYDK